MKQLKTTPQKARVKGNLVPEYDTLEDIPEYEDYHVSHQLLQKYTYQDVTKNVIRLTPKGDTLYLALTVDNNTINLNATSNITCRCYYKDDMEQEVNLSGHTVYVYDNNSLLTTLVTNSNGLIQVPYSTNIEGKHTLSFKTMYSGGYAPATKNITITVYRKSILTVNTNSLQIAHDEKKTITWKLTDKNGKALVGKPITIYEGIRQLATKNTDSKGEVKYTYLESTNRGTETVLTKSGNIRLIQNQVNKIEGYLKDKNGNPLANQKVHLYMGLSAYSQANATTDANGKFSINYTPTVYGEYEYYLVYHSNVVNTTNNQYQTYEPTMLSLGVIQPKRSPQLNLTVNSNTTTVGSKIKFNIKVSDDDYNFQGQDIQLQFRTKGASSYTNIVTLKIDANNSQTYEYTTENTGEYDFIIYYAGDEEHVANKSADQRIKINGKTINITTTLPNNSVCVTQDYYPITSKVTDANNNPVKNIVLKYYLDVEGGTNDEGLIGTATTDNNGNVTFTGFKGMNTYNTVKATIGTHTIITKHELDTTYIEKKITNTISVIKRTRELAVTSANSTQLDHNQFKKVEITNLNNWTNYPNTEGTYSYTNPSLSNNSYNPGRYYFTAFTGLKLSIRSKVHMRLTMDANAMYAIGFLRDDGVDTNNLKKAVRGVSFNSNGNNIQNATTLPKQNNMVIDVVIENGNVYININGEEYTYTGAKTDTVSRSEQTIWSPFIYSGGANGVLVHRLEIVEYIPYSLNGTLIYRESINNSLYNTNNHDIKIETTGLTEQPLLKQDWYKIDSFGSMNVTTDTKKFTLTPFTSENASTNTSIVTEHSIDSDGKLVIGNQKYLYYNFDPTKNFSAVIELELNVSGWYLLGTVFKKGSQQSYVRIYESTSTVEIQYLNNINGTQTTEEKTTTGSLTRTGNSNSNYHYSNRIIIQKQGNTLTLIYYDYTLQPVTVTKTINTSTANTGYIYFRCVNTSMKLTSFNFYEYVGDPITGSNKQVKLDYGVDSIQGVEKSTEGLIPAFRSIMLYRYPITVNANTNKTFEFETDESNTAYKDICICKLSNEKILEEKIVTRMPTFSGTKRKIRVEFSGLNVTIIDITTNTTILDRTLTASNVYIGFQVGNKYWMVINKMYNTSEALSQYNILDTNNWTFTENLTLDTSSTLSRIAYVTNNSYLFPGIRQNCVLTSRPLNITKDTYIRIRTYQNNLDLRVGVCSLNSNGTVSDIFTKRLRDVTDNTGWGVHEYVLRVNPIENKNYDMIIDDTNTGNSGSNYTNKQMYVFIYNIAYSCYIQDISVRQDDINIKTTSGEWGTTFVPYGFGTYNFKITAIETDWYKPITTNHEVTVTEKIIPTISLDNITAKKGTNKTINISVPYDATNKFTVKVFASNGTSTVLANNLEQTDGSISVTTNFSTYNVGHYTYRVEYQGDDKYLDTITSKKTLDIGDNFKIVNNEQVNNTITVQALTSLKLTGTVKTPFNDNYSGTMNCLIDDVLYTQMPANEGVYNSNNTIIDLKQLGLSVGNHSLKLVVQGNNTFATYTLSLTLNVIKNNTAIIGQPVAMKKGGTTTWSAIVPKDFDGSIYIYSIDENGNYITGSTGSSILTSIRADSSSLTVSNETTTTKKVSWNDKWDPNNTTTVNNVKNEAGEHYIKYRLYNDSVYADTTNNTVLFNRQQATISTEDVRGFENEDRKINIRCIDTLNNPYQGAINVYIDGTKTGTVTTNANGEATYTLSKTNRKYDRNDAHTTDVKFEYVFQESGSWSSLNAIANSTSYNVKTGFYGIFVNKTPALTLANLQSFKTLGITDLYVRKNTESSSTALVDTIQLLEENNLRQYFRVHAVFNCNKNVSAEGEPWYTDTQKGSGHLIPSRITDLQNHIDTLLGLDIDGICFDYIRLASSTAYPHFEEEISNETIQLTQFIKDRTPNETIIISACTVPEVDVSISNYGQNYKVFEENLDYVLPMMYCYVYSNINETNPIESGGIMWEQNILNKIYNQSLSMNDGINKKNNKVVPVIQTYKGDGHETESLSLQGFINQIISMWNYGIERNNTQKCMVFFRHGYMTQNPPRYDYITSSTNTAFQIELEPIIRIPTIDRSTGTLYILWRTKYGGYPSNAGQAYIKIDGTTITKNGSTYYHDINNNGSVAMEVDLTKYTLGTHTVTIVFEGNVEKHIKSGTWNTTITLV